MGEPREDEVVIVADGQELPGTLTIPRDPQGVVIFAHGSGSSRHSVRNRAVAGTLLAQGCATLLFDLLAPEEAAERKNVFDIALLATRVRAATKWIGGHPALADCAIGYFGASTGSAAALVAAADVGGAIVAVVSRGGRPDLAGTALEHILAPTLLIVGSRDTTVLTLNEEAYARMKCACELLVIDGATHLFEEPGALEAVAVAAARWFGDRF